MRSALDINIQAFCDFYAELSLEGINRLEALYHPEIRFQDPVMKLQGLKNLEAYFKHGLENSHYCRFQVHNFMTQNDQVCVQWQMRLSHPKLNRGKEISTQGASVIRFENDLIIYHRDYFDLGEMLYEQLPLLGKLIKFIKRRLKHD